MYLPNSAIFEGQMEVINSGGLLLLCLGRPNITHQF
jgi:hypothetical protein